MHGEETGNAVSGQDSDKMLAKKAIANKIANLEIEVEMLIKEHQERKKMNSEKKEKGKESLSK